MLPPTCDANGDKITANVAITTAVGLRYVVISIGVFTSNHHRRQDHEAHAMSTSLEEQEKEPLKAHVIDISSDSDCGKDWDGFVRIVENGNWVALQRLGGVDRGVSLQRSHFEENEVSDASDSTQDHPQEYYWKTSTQARSFFYFLLQAFNNCTILLLFISAGLLFAIQIIEQGPQDGWHDGTAVLFAIFLLVSLSSVGKFCRERKHVKKLLKEKNKLRVDVERNGKSQNVPICDVKVFDTVHLKQGDLVPANGLFIKGENLKLDEEQLNSKPIDKDRNPNLFFGSQVVEGHSSMLVTSTISSKTDVVPSDLDDPNEETLLQSLLDKAYGYVENLGLSISVLISFVVLIRILFKKHDSYNNELPEIKGPLEMKLLMELFEKLILKPQGKVSILSSALVTFIIGVQHGTYFVLGVFLSYSNKKLVNVAELKHLSSSCTLGRVTQIIVDATGGLLCEQVEVKEFWIGEREMIRETQDPKTGQSNEINLLQHLGIGLWDHVSQTNDLLFPCIPGWKTRDTSNEKQQVLEYRRTSSSGKKGCEVFLRRIGDEEEGGGERSLHLHWKGTPLTILETCSDFYDSGGEKHTMENGKKKHFENVIKDMENKGLRPIAFAYKETKVEELESDGLSLLAIVGLKYPCKEEVKSLVDALREDGLVIKLVSEDDLPRVKFIALELGFFGPGSNDKETEAENIRGDPLLVDRITVIGNSLPEDKVLMVNKLQENGSVVAFYGGLRRDMLALKKADVGITQDNRCTEMAKKASDISLKRLDHSVIRIMKSGRSQYRNIQDFFQLQLTASISGLIIILVSTMHSGESPLSSLQMTWVNLILCLLGGLMMGMELNGKDCEPAKKRTQPLITKVIWTNIAIQVSYQFILLLSFEYYASNETGKDVAETMVFNCFTLCQLFHLLNVINLANKEVLEIVLCNYWFCAAFAAVCFFHAIAIQFGKGLLSGGKLNVRQWTTCFLLAAFSSLFYWAIKWLIAYCYSLALNAVSSYLQLQSYRRFVSYYLVFPFSMFFLFSASYYFHPDIARTFR